MNTDENKKKIVMLFIALGLMLSIIIGVTFSYLAPLINNLENESTVAFNAGVIAIDYESGSNRIEASEILPGWSEVKKFSLTATNTTSINKADAMNYSLKLVVESNTFSDNAIAVSLKSTNTSNNGTVAEIIPGTLPSGKSEVSLGFGSFDATQNIGEAGATHNFELTVSFPEQNKSQSSDMGKHLSAHVTVEKANDLGTLTIVDNFEDINKTTSVEKNKEINLLSLNSSSIKKYFSIVSGEGIVNTNKLTLTGDEMKVTVNYPSIIDTITALDKDTNGLEVDDTSVENLRYVGANPNNYIEFNNEIWRIIGVFKVYNTETGQTEKLTKIIRNESLGEYSWDSSIVNLNMGYGINEWSQADLMTELNTDYINTSKTSGTTTWYNGSNNQKNGSYDYSKNIKSDAIEKIATVRWNLGGISNTQSALNSYNAERGTTHIVNSVDNVTRTDTWDGKIALMYPSDYGYASTNSACRTQLSSKLYNCKYDNWLFNSSYQWTLSPSSSVMFGVYTARSNGNVDSVSASIKYDVRPTLFLKSDILIVSGTGNEKDPYKIEVEQSETGGASFANDTWETIADNVINEKASLYNVGDEKEVEIDGTNYTVRVANNTTPDECSGDDFSQTACGFVVEFVDIVEKLQMNSTNTNDGGWPASGINEYANGTFFDNLPSDLQDVIIDTKVISGHGTNKNDDRTDGNWESDDKIYLLNATEIWNSKTLETAYSNTRQLDYYANNNVTTSSNIDIAIKKYNDTNTIWWLRTATASVGQVQYPFGIVMATGKQSYLPSGVSNGFAPAFRIGK